MAKRKLSAEQRAEIRDVLKKAVESGRKTSEVLQEVSEKYGITTITARWYLNSLNGKPKRVGRPKGKPGRKPGRRGRKLGRPPGSGDVSRLTKFVEEQATRAKKAQRLMTRWQAAATREAALQRQAAKVQRQADAASRKVASLRKRLNALVGSP